jgi:DNA-binding response OmpR family regulator
LRRKSDKADKIMLFRRVKRCIQRILVVEDEPLIAFDAEHALGQAGYTVVATVPNASDALRWIDADEPPDLVLSDVRLAGQVDGVALAREACAREVHVLFIAAAVPPEGRAHGLGWLAKPFQPRDLAAAVACADALMHGLPMPAVPVGLTLFDE